jgi:hypothetical protein
MSDWGITTKVPAEVVLAEGIGLAGDLHLYARTTYPPGPETPLEMLNRVDVFFALTLVDGGVVFIPKAQVVVVSCRDQARLVDPERESAARQVELDVTVQGGGTYRGRATLELHPSRSRSLDYLNGSGVFFALGSDDVTWYINKARVQFARPLD